MGRIRTIKPEFFLHEELCELSPLHRLLFVGLWTQADRAGRLEDRPKRLKAVVLPYDKVDVDRLLDDLSEHRGRFIVRYEHEGVRYIAIPGFLHHQRPHVRELPSTTPAPTLPRLAREMPAQDYGESGADHNLNPAEHNLAGAGLDIAGAEHNLAGAGLTSRARALEGKGKEGKGKEGKGAGTEAGCSPAAAPLSPLEESSDGGRQEDPVGLLALFRAIVWPGKEWPIDLPGDDLNAARGLLAAHPVPRLKAIFEFVARNKPNSKWSGWRTQAGTLCGLARNLDTIDGQAFGAPLEDLSPDAQHIERWLDMRLRQRDEALALAPPDAVERSGLNALVSKHGRARVKFAIYAGLEKDGYLRRKLTSVQAVINAWVELVSKSADAWPACKDETWAWDSPVPERSVVL